MQANWPELSKNRRIQWYLDSLKGSNDEKVWGKIQNIVLLTTNGRTQNPFLESLIPDDYAPGTFLIDERKDFPPYLDANERHLGLEGWITKIVDSDLNTISYQLSLQEKDISNLKGCIAKDIYTILTFKYAEERSLAERIWNQEYSDIIRRLELLLLTGQADYELDLYNTTNLYARDVCVELIHRFEHTRKTSLHDWCFLSVATGLVGLNKKSSIDATSHFYRQSEIPLFLNKSIQNNATRIYEDLLSIIERSHIVDQSSIFLEKFQVASKSPIAVMVFTDDYIETIFLLKLYEILLTAYSNLRVILVPKSKICGNDATMTDVLDLLELPEFARLKSLLNSRFFVRNDGPKIGGLNLLKLSETILGNIAEADFLDIRGCRAFEMAQGIKKEAFYSFNVIREISESITGLDGETQHFIFVKQNPGERCYRGFRDRHKYQQVSPSGRKYMVVPYTVLNYYNEKT